MRWQEQWKRRVGRVGEGSCALRMVEACGGRGCAWAARLSDQSVLERQQQPGRGGRRLAHRAEGGARGVLHLAEHRLGVEGEAQHGRLVEQLFQHTQALRRRLLRRLPRHPVGRRLLLLLLRHLHHQLPLLLGVA